MKGLVIAYIGFAVVALGGWIANIVKLINSGFEVAQWGGMEVARVIGIFVAPLGAVLGFC
jgi:hypothetical protein